MPGAARHPPWCNGSTTAFGAVRSRFESWRRSVTDIDIDDHLAIVILAAGQGTRMKSALPKVLHRIGGRPLVGHVIHTAQSLGARHIRVVVRHERDAVVEAIHSDAPHVDVVDQDDIPGTGRAVQVALAQLPEGYDGDVLVLSGDVPLLSAETLSQLVAAHRATGAAATLLSALLDDPTGYGRVIRGADGGVERIVEQKDASDDEASVHEINAGVYVFRAPQLRAHIELVGTANAQGERYLTDVIALLRDSSQDVAATTAPDPARRPRGQ